jgi:hypothetical protein
VLGRFDGVHGTYQWADERRLHVMLGYPVETTLDGVKTDRQFVGAAVDFDHVVGRWGVSPYVQSQKVAGISDRQAVGVEVRYLDDTRSLTTMLDYDTLYGELNTALAFGTWRLNNRITLTGLYDERTSIFTRNALIGQPVSTFDDLLRTWTEDELRQIARDRTATSTTASFGITMPFGERLQLNADVTTLEIGPSVDSAGVAAVPGTGQQVYYSGTLVASALFGQRDVNVLNLRYGEGPDFTTTLVTWDTRVPIGKRLRINPRLRFGVWENTATAVRRETVTPALRLLWNAPRRYRLELEIGREALTRTASPDELDSTGKYLNVGYRADFAP